MIRSTEPRHEIKIKTNSLIMPAISKQVVRRKERKINDVEEIVYNYEPWQTISYTSLLSMT